MVRGIPLGMFHQENPALRNSNFIAYWSSKMLLSPDLSQFAISICTSLLVRLVQNDPSVQVQGF